LWQPKSEAAMCALIAFALDLYFKHDAVLVNREVMIKPTNHQGAGERTDLYIQSRQLKNYGSSGPMLEAKVVIEVKGSWNKGLLTSQETQLAERYLKEVGGTAGLYVVFWPDVELWTDTSDHRLAAARRQAKTDVSAALGKQADEIMAGLGYRIDPIIFRVGRPVPAE
jgi:hypothetical protein